MGRLPACLLMVLCLAFGEGVAFGDGAALPDGAAAAPDKARAPAVGPDHARKMALGLEVWKSQVRELLVKNCLQCHGGEKTKGEFDLSTREKLLRGGSGGPVIVLGKSAESRLLKLVAHQEKPYMPQRGARLSPDAVAGIAAWIDAGAPFDRPLVEKPPVPKGRPVVTDGDRQFWSFQPLARPEPPEPEGRAWCRTPIDRFILSALEENGLAPNPPAGARKLIRRASLDLIGLPPSPEEVEAFVEDHDPAAYEKLIDRLLESPHYGERWGRHWLDLARFAESHGFEHDYDRPTAYHYRDFVIQALNQDLAYDRFVSLQIAGDEIEPENPLALMATGFLAAGVHSTQITANQVEKERYDEMDDMASTVGTAILGLTVGCARCHDHKYDPIPQHDYYRLISTFTTTVRSEIDLDLHPERIRIAREEFEKSHAPLRAALERFEREKLPARLERWLASGPRRPEPRWIVLDELAGTSKGGATLERLEDGSLLAKGTNPEFDTYTLTARTRLQGITALKLEPLAHPSLPKNGPGRAPNGNFALSSVLLRVAPLDGAGPAVEPKLLNAQATFEQKGLPVAAAIDGDAKSAWAVDPQFGKDHAARFELEGPAGFPEGSLLTLTLKFENNAMHGIGRVRVSVSTAPPPVGLDGEEAPQSILAEVRRILDAPAAKRSDSDRATLLKWYRRLDPEWVALHRQVEDHLKAEPRAELTKVLVASEGVPAVRLHTQGADFFEKTFFLKAGDPSQKEGEATAGFLQVLERSSDLEKRWRAVPPPGWRTSYRRRSLAAWMTDVEHGAGSLLARVMVNRLWQHHLGRGIVTTPSDFGAQGERPSHPQLLDWLAGELVRQGFRLKPIHKLIMQSAVYLEGTEIDPRKAAIDPENRLFWRRFRSRLEAETIRDAMLSVSGLLDPAMFGPGTLDEGQRRRSIYFTVKRSQLIPVMTLFDAPDGLQGMGLRSSTTVAPQALLMMNNAQVQSCARALARRILPGSGRPAAEAVAAGYRLVLGRPPSEGEVADAVEFLERQTESYRSDGRKEPLEAALADFSQALLGLNEFIYLE